MFSCYEPGMEQDNGSDQNELEPAPRDDVLFSIRFALSKGFNFRPRKRDYGTAAFDGWAKAILEQLELAGLRFFRRKPRPWHSWPPEGGSEGDSEA